jgi:hypothetical protein
MYKVKAKKNGKSFFLRSVLLRMMMILKWLTVSIHDYHLLSFLSKPLCISLTTSWILVPFHLIFTASFCGQGLLFVYIFSIFFLLIRFLDDIKAYVCILSICLSFLLLKNSLLINGMTTMLKTEAKCLYIYNNNIR